MEKLRQTIIFSFPTSYSIEVFALDENGDNFDVYRGLVQDLRVEDLIHTTRSPSCIYVFTIIGMDAHPHPNPNHAMQSLIRKEFCWLTEPPPPKALDQTPNSLTVFWSPVQCCGVDVNIILTSIVYTLEVAEGRELGNKKFSKYSSEVGAGNMQFKRLCSGPQLYSAEVTDLMPNTCYYFRLSIEYANTRVTSAVSAIPTLQGVPNPPLIPRVKIDVREGHVDTIEQTKVQLHWSPPFSNGSPVRKYQLQIKEVRVATYKDLVNRDFVSRIADGHGHLSSDEEEKGDTDDIVPHDEQLVPGRPRSDDDLGGKLIASDWKTVYKNCHCDTKVGAPSESAIKWFIRVRAQNEVGWSPYSPVLTISFRSHPSLFPAGFTFVQSLSSGDPLSNHPERV
jgi:hypothetical protein